MRSAERIVRTIGIALDASTSENGVPRMKPSIYLSTIAIPFILFAAILTYARHFCVHQSGVSFGYERAENQVYTKPNIYLTTKRWVDRFAIASYSFVFSLAEPSRMKFSEINIIFMSAAFQVDDYDCAILYQRRNDTLISYYKGSLRDAFQGRGSEVATKFISYQKY